MGKKRPGYSERAADKEERKEEGPREELTVDVAPSQALIMIDYVQPCITRLRQGPVFHISAINDCTGLSSPIASMSCQYTIPVSTIAFPWKTKQ